MAEAVLTRRSQRILIVGSSGQGKSSLINLLCDEKRAVVSSGARGCTLQCEDHSVQYANWTYFLTDTVGFNEPNVGGAVSHNDAIKNLVKFAKQHEDGFNLIVFVMKRARITKSFKETYDFFYEVLFSQAIPCILYLSGSELDDDMDEWFKHEKQYFDGTFRFQQVVSGTTLVHSNAHFEAVFAPKRAETRIKMWKAIEQLALKEPFHMRTGINFWYKALNFFYYYFSFGGTLFKSQVKADVQKKLRDMKMDEATIRDIMATLD